MDLELGVTSRVGESLTSFITSNEQTDISKGFIAVYKIGGELIDIDHWGWLNIVFEYIDECSSNILISVF